MAAQTEETKALATEAEAFELDELAVKCLAAGDEQGAIDAAVRALDMFEDLSVHPDMREAHCFQTLTNAHLEAKDTQAALKVAKDCVERFKDSGNSRGHGIALQLLSLVQSKQGYLGKAVRSSQRAAYAFEDGGYTRGRAEALVTAGTIWSRLGLFNKALRLLQDALTDFEELNDQEQQASTLLQRAEVCLQKNDTKSAVRCAIESREIYLDAHDKNGEAVALLKLCAAQMAENDLDKAARSAEEAQGLASDAKEKAEGTPAAFATASATEADAYRAVADVSAKTGQYESALKAGQRALALYRDLGDHQVDEASTLIANAGNQIMVTISKEERGQATEKTIKEGSDRAVKYAKEALSIAKRLSEPQVIGAALHTVAQCYTMAGKPTEAMKAANEGLDLFRQHGDLRGEAGMLVNIANITLLCLGDIQKARDAAEEGVWLFQHVGDAAGEDQGWEMLDRIQKAVEDKRKEQQLLQQQQQMSMALAAGAATIPANLPPAEEAIQEHEQKKDVVLSVAKLDVGSGLSPAQIHKQISDIAKALIGEDDDIDLDTPLMEAGLTSNTAVQLRNGLSENMPGINLPVTLTFDYPSIGAMTDLILEGAKKIKR